MIIKLPAVYDISHWKSVPDFDQIQPRPIAIITKATEGVSFVDSKFVDFFIRMKQAGYIRGAYHFNRRAYDGAGQARHFINIIESYVDDNTLLILDVEEGGETAAQLKAWFDTVRARFPNNRQILYSRRNILEAIPMTSVDRAYFRTIPTWIAGYPTNPDGYDSIPNFYIPDQLRFGPPWLWQYSDNGVVPGIIGDVDLNWIDPTFAQILGTPPTGEPQPMTRYEATNLYNGMGLRADHATTSNLISRYPASTKWNGDEIWTSFADSFLNGVQTHKTGDKWLHVSSVGDAPAGGWVALVHLGTKYCDIVDSGPTEPPPSIAIPDYLIAHFPDGSEKTYLPE